MSEFRIGDIVEVIAANDFKAMPEGLSMGSRGTVIGDPAAFYVHVDYGLSSPVWSARTAIRKVQPPPQDWVKLCNLDSLPKEIAHV